MRTRYKHIHSERLGEEDLAKPVFVCKRNKLNFCVLGEAGYSPHWEKYLFITKPNTALDATILKEIAKFLKQLK